MTTLHCKLNRQHDFEKFLSQSFLVQKKKRTKKFRVPQATQELTSTALWSRATFLHDWKLKEELFGGDTPTPSNSSSPKMCWAEGEPSLPVGLWFLVLTRELQPGCISVPLRVQVFWLGCPWRNTALQRLTTSFVLKTKISAAPTKIRYCQATGRLSVK